MENVKCECGHVNPHGTVLCESCGRQIDNVNNEEQKQVDMRYDGSARRSQTYNKTIIDKIWNFFSSVKVGVWLIVITLIASAFGTIYPQLMYIPNAAKADPAAYYESQYGVTGKLYYELGFHELYGSWWYLILIGSIGISLVICSLDRVIPLYRALKKQGISRHHSFLKRQRLYSESQLKDNENSLATVREKLLKKRYNVREENGNILAEKGRFSRWGPYVNHVGLIIFLIGVLVRSVPGVYIDKSLWMRDGETNEIPGTNGQYYLQSHGFKLDVYEKDSEKEVFEDALAKIGDGVLAKNYQTDVTLYERVGDFIPGAEPELKKIKDFAIRVNEPLKYDHYALYQADFKLNEFREMSFKLVEKENEDVSLGELTIDLHNPQEEYDLGEGYQVKLLKYFPDYYLNSNGEPDTKLKIPNNPAFVFEMYTPDTPEGERSFVAIRQNIEPNGDNKYKVAFSGIETVNVSGLTVRRDFSLAIIAIGGAIFMIGVIQGMYWNHRRIWFKREGDLIYIAGHTNKNWFSLKKDITSIIEGTQLVMPVDQVEDRKKQAKGD
ncbi:cytochrome c biogenesis protein ResB [Cytobacillus sp. IB215665]|uniref:cytochrome c biogenesis protein ResB n=1 Tax=Cytobacillus sp. IB215665 TaxID=3097357 RepID=UPI002A0AC0D0|nr:cytochrome c biogenesis protein ResB [Cytobacillus sp. IB215665]MDX8364793.1 cytochrome c biogenesis protein ResB [Cytobacillus sp. IB215665]